VLSAEHLLELGALHERLQGVEGGREVFRNVLARSQPLHQDVRVVLVAAQALQKA
jgi:hypothetical protein